MSSPHEIPSIPILPPLEMPSTLESDETTGLVHLSVPVDSPPVAFLQSPVPSFADSFSTALTSPIYDGEDTLKRTLPPLSLYPSQSLKKSVSVDSFVHYARETSSPPESARSSLLRDQGALEFQTHSTSQLPWTGRFRGESLSSVRRGDAAPRTDVDVDLYNHSVSTAPEQTPSRRPSLVDQDVSKSPAFKGNLPLPSRTRNNSNATAPSSPQEVAELASNSSMSSLPSSTNRGTSLLNPGRVRSGSVGYIPPSSSKRIAMNTLPAFPPPEISQTTPHEDGIVLAVIGKRGCGKSTVIRKGLPAGYNMVEVSRQSEDSHAAGLPRFVRRVGTIPEDPTTSPPSPPRYLEIFELDIQTTDAGIVIWPRDFPKFDGIMICYNSFDSSSYEPVESILKLHHHSTGLSLIALACKADLEHIVDPTETLEMLKQYDTGLIEVSIATEYGREKMKQSFKYMLKAVLRHRGPEKGATERNPASPSLLVKGSPWSEHDNDEYPANPAPQIPATEEPPPVYSLNIPESPLSNDHSDDTPSTTAQSPSWPQPTPDTSFNSDQQSPQEGNQDVSISGPEDSNHEHLDSIEHSPGVLDDARHSINEKKNAAKERLTQVSQYVELEAILDKLLFLAVSGEDPTYITHFLLTYRRFTTPRSVLLAMQKRMRMLDNPCGDPMFACFAQMRICHFLEIWIRDFPHDFAVQGTMGALNALIKSIISKTHLLHYGSEFLPFLEQLPDLEDQDVAWAMKGEISDNDSEDSDNDDEELRITKTQIPDPEPSVPPASSGSPKITFPTRERKSSIPLPKSILPYSYNEDQSPKQQIKDLVKLAQEVLSTDSREIAEEITRTWVKQFMLIKPRDWLYYTFITIAGKGKATDNDSIVTFNIMSNHLADWVVSLILCHDRPRNRLRQIEKFVDIANKLRNMNNYSALRAFVAGINNAMDDPTTDYFKSKSPDASKNLMSWDVLLQQIRAHRAYRMALRNSKGGCIPAMEVHMSDLIKAQEVNKDFKGDLVHWGKFNMMGRFISTTVQCQVQCSNTMDYEFPERPHIAELFVKRPLMSFEMQKSRLKSDDEYDDYRPPVTSSRPPTDVRDMRRIFFS